MELIFFILVPKTEVIVRFKETNRNSMLAIQIFEHVSQKKAFDLLIGRPAELLAIVYARDIVLTGRSADLAI